MNSNEENDLTTAPAPPIRPKKHIRIKIVNRSFNKKKSVQYSNKLIKKVDNKEIKAFEELLPLPSKEDWSIFSPNFINNAKKEETPMHNSNNMINNTNNIINNTLNKEPFRKVISKSLINFPKRDGDALDKLLKLEKEVNGLKETNQNLLNLIMEKEKENRILINNIDKYKVESIENMTDYLNFIEELGKKFKFTIDDNDDINLDIKNGKNGLNETNEINIELNKNKQLKKILTKKNKEFNDIKEALQKLIFKDNSPLLNYSNLIINNNENKSKIYNNDEENENINFKNEYNILKEEYNKLNEKYKQNEQKNKGNKNRIKYVYKDIPQNQKKEYESKIKELIEENQKIKQNYNKKIEKINIDIGSLKVEYLNKQFDNETNLLNIKKKIKQLIKQCQSQGIKINNEIIN